MISLEGARVAALVLLHCLVLHTILIAAIFHMGERRMSSLQVKEGSDDYASSQRLRRTKYKQLCLVDDCTEY